MVNSDRLALLAFANLGPICISNLMNSHEVEYELYGDDMQMVEIELDPQETVIAEAGSMNWMEEDIDFETKMGDGSEPDKGMFG